jgi:putative endonuclease
MWGFFVMHYLYILYSPSKDRYYVGETIDMAIRLNQHLEGFYKGSYTSKTKDWELKLVIEFNTISQARKAEIFIKWMKSKKFVEGLLKDAVWFIEKFNV